MNRTILSSAIAALALSTTAMADTFSYNQVDLKVIGAAIDDGSSDPDVEGAGLGVSGSWEFASHVFGYAGISGVEYSYDGDDLGTATQGTLGVGFNIPLGSRLDLITGASYERASFFDNYDDDVYAIDGYGIRLGLRGLIGKRFDWNVGANYVDVGGDGETAFGAGFRVLFSRMFGMGLDLATSESHGISTGTAAIGFRFQFGDRD